jgi:hypothetical protein
LNVVPSPGFPSTRTPRDTSPDTHISTQRHGSSSFDSCDGLFLHDLGLALADRSAWLAFLCTVPLRMPPEALTLARHH